MHRWRVCWFRFVDPPLLDQQEFNEYSTNNEYFLYQKCVTFASFGQFDFSNSLKRLHSTPTVLACQSKRRMTRLYGAVDKLQKVPDVDYGTEDAVSIDILRRFHGVTLDTTSPRHVQGDSNCLFRSASLAAYNIESNHAYLCLVTAIELIEQSEAYDATSPLKHIPLFSSPVPPSAYDKLVNDVTTDGAYSELAHMYALSAAMGCNIQSYMPPTTAIWMDNPYTKVIVGRGVSNGAGAKFTLM